MFNIFGEKVKLKFVDDLQVNGGRAWGSYSYADKVISIDSQLLRKGNEKMLTITLCHEMIHAVFDALSFHQTTIDYNLEQLIADNLAKAIANNIYIDTKQFRK